MTTKSPIEVLIIEARVAAGAAWETREPNSDERAARDILRRCASMLETIQRESNGYAESLDNIREALGQKATHHLVMPGDIEELVKAVEADVDSKAAAVLRRLRTRDA